MRNLKLCSHSVEKLCCDRQFSKICVNPVLKEVFAVHSGGIHSFKQKSSSHDSLQRFQESWDSCTSSMTDVVSFDFVTSINCFCIAFKEGDVITANIEEHSVDVAGSVEDGIHAACWSPDQELLALVTSSLSLILMTADFEPVGEVSLEQDDFGENKFINVGWGKRETQFHGSEGKQAAKQVKKNVAEVLEWDDRTPRISWRGDGQLFAVSYVSRVSNERKFRVINREAFIQYTSETIEGLEQSLSWKPSGSLIAASQRLSNKHTIVFFEKNGLQHGQFTLPFGATEVNVKELSWNADSSVLLVWLVPIIAENEGSVLQFWKVGNYHWYLKEEIKFSEKINDFSWDLENPFTLYVLTQTNFHTFGFTLTTDVSRGLSEEDSAYVAVVDGQKLLLTPFRDAIVPPPLSAYEIIFPDQIHAVMFAPPVSKETIHTADIDSGSAETSELPKTFELSVRNSNSICVFHGTDTLTFLIQADPEEKLTDFNCEVKINCTGGNGFKVKHKIHRILSQYKIEVPTDETPSSGLNIQLYNWLWVCPTAIVSSYISERQNYIAAFDLKCIENEQTIITCHKSVQVKDEVVSIACPSDSAAGSLICLQLITGELFRFTLSDDAFTPWMEDGHETSFPTPCDRLILCTLNSGTIHKPLGLSSRNKLYLGNAQLLSNCTSVHLYNNYLLLTTAAHNLLVVPLVLDILLSLSSGVSEKFTNVGCRQLERGSRLVTAVPCDMRVLLQMPRGNLEVISPRPLVVHVLKSLLDDHKYCDAVDIMRRHRIDMNLLYDHNPKDFMEHTEEYIKNVNHAQWIDLFIANLNKDDVTLTAYSGSYSHRNFSNAKPCDINSDKTELVSEALRRAMIAVDEEKFLLPILTTFIKSSKENMHLALMKLKSMKDSEKQYKVSFEEGLRHLMYISDANELCDVALGTYDFNLAMFVFEKSQRDPKEYLPFLNNLKKLEPDYQKFKINVHLKNYKKAVECLTDYTEYGEECLHLIKKETLYADALEVIPKNCLFYKSVCVAYGRYLSGKGYDTEAAALYARGGDLQSSLKAYEVAGNWRMVLSTAFQLQYSKQQLNELYHSLVDQLKDKSLFYDAAVLYEKYLRSEEDAIECLTKARLWEEAYLLASSSCRDDLIETNIKPAIGKCYETFITELHQKKTTYDKLFSRLTAVRAIKKEEYMDFLEGGGCVDPDLDLRSDISARSNISALRSNVTSASGKSYRSSKNKRKLERKKYSAKEGSSYEDVGLIASLHDTMVGVDSLLKPISDLNRALLMTGDDLKARTLQHSLDELLRDMLKKRYDIWINCAPSQEDAVEFGPQMTTESALKHMIHGESVGDSTFIVKRISELEPNLRYPPVMGNSSSWKLFSLR